jgi:hypothetical protein
MRKESLVPFVLLGASVASAAEPSVSELQKRIEELESRLSQLEPTTTGPSADSVDRAIAEVRVEADRQSQLLALEGVTAGYDRGFFIQSADGAFSIRPGFQFQFRSIANYRDNPPNTLEDDSFETGFEVRRTRFRFDGNAFSKDLTYSLIWDTSRSGGGVTLLDAVVAYKLAPTWTVKVGQFKENVFQEKNVSGFSQLAVDRSLVDAVLGGNLTDRVQGIAVAYGASDKPLRAEFAFHDGANSKNTNFQDGATNFGFGGRAEYKFFGNWSDYRDFTAKNGKEDLLVLGIGADVSDRRGTVLTTPGSVTVLPGIDLQYEHDGKLSLFASANARYQDLRNTTGEDSRLDYGFVVQAGYLVNPKWEPFVRYDVIFLDDDFVGSGVDDTIHEITAGVNYYLGPDGAYQHRAKVTVDVIYLPDGTGPLGDQNGLGLLSGSDTQFAVRAQFQLAL